MLWAVAAASPATTTMAGTMLMAKAPRTILIRYSAPAILASWRGGVPPMESINDFPQLVLTAAANCTDLSETVRTMVGMTRIKPPRDVTCCDGRQIAFD